MKRDGTNRRARIPGNTPGLALLVPLCFCHLLAFSDPAAAQQQEAVRSAPEPAPRQPPANNWFNVSTPGRAALARPDSFLPYGPPPSGVCCPGRKSGSCLRRLIAWAVYCPKYRVCSCTSCCNSCQYKGIVPLYLYFLTNPNTCVEGSNLHATVPNTCYRGSKSCAAGPACGHR